jgi:hypothetical protein
MQPPNLLFRQQYSWRYVSLYHLIRSPAGYLPAGVEATARAFFDGAYASLYSDAGAAAYPQLAALAPPAGALRVAVAAAAGRSLVAYLRSRAGECRHRAGGSAAAPRLAVERAVVATRRRRTPASDFRLFLTPPSAPFARKCSPHS